MKKLIIFCSIFLITYHVNAQLLEQYKASNGINYKIKDTVWLGKGSGNNAQFLYLTLTGAVAVLTYNTNYGPDQLNIDRSFQNTYGIIKRITSQGSSDQKKIVFILICKGHTHCALVIDDAIDACEVVPCLNNTPQQQIPPPSIADELLKLKAY